MRSFIPIATFYVSYDPFECQSEEYIKVRHIFIAQFMTSKVTLVSMILFFDLLH